MPLNKNSGNMVMWKKAFIAMAVCCLGLGVPPTQLSGDSTTDDTEEELVGELPGIGKLALDLQPEYQGVRHGRLFWLFQTLQIEWEPNADGIAIYRVVNFNQHESTADLQLRRQPDKSLAFEIGGLITPDRLKVLQTCIFQSAPVGSFDDLASFLRANNQIEKFTSRGSLNPLPTSFPGPFMDVTVLLCSEDVHSLGALLQHPNLSSEVLDSMGYKMLNAKPGSDFYAFSHSWLMAILAAHPHLSKEVLAQFFAEKDNPEVWRAVALNPNAPSDYRASYLTRINEGDTRIRVFVARDRLAPREAWEAAIAKGEPGVLVELARNPKVPSDLLGKVARQNPQAAVAMAGNIAAPQEVLQQLSQSHDKQVLWSLQRNPSVQGNVVQVVLENLATNSGSSARGAAALDQRTPPELLEKLSGDSITFVRGQTAMNPACPEDILERLADDPYSQVSERARDNLTRRFASDAIRLTPTWKPLDQLTPYSTPIDDFQRSLTNGDVAKARTLLAITSEEDAIPIHIVVSNILQNRFDVFSDLLKQYVISHGDEAHYELIGSDRLQPNQVVWMKANGLLDGKWTSAFITDLTQQNRPDLLQAADDAGLLSQATQQQKNQGLQHATVFKDANSIRLWLKAGAKS